MNNRTGLHRTRRSGCAPAEISQNNFAGLGKRIAGIEAGEDDWNLARDSGSIPCHRFPWCRTRVLGFQLEIVSKFLCVATLGKILFGIRNRDDCLPPWGFSELGATDGLQDRSVLHRASLQEPLCSYSLTSCGS